VKINPTKQQKPPAVAGSCCPSMIESDPRQV
jgi:hypothetical protein